MINRFLHIQGLAGLVLSLAVVGLLLLQKSETRHWRKQSGQFEQLYHGQQAAFAGTVANYRAAADQARAPDRAAAERIQAQQRAISERINNAFQDRLADARVRAQRVRVQISAPSADPGHGREAAMPNLSAGTSGSPQASGEDGLSLEDRLTATEQAIQLDELIKWIRWQHAVDPNTMP